VNEITLENFLYPILTLTVSPEERLSVRILKVPVPLVITTSVLSNNPMIGSKYNFETVGSEHVTATGILVPEVGEATVVDVVIVAITSVTKTISLV
jgi:hypothetical protein